MRWAAILPALFFIVVPASCCENSLEEYIFVIKNSLIVDRDNDIVSSCQADYGNFARYLPSIQNLVNKHLSLSFQHMSVFSHFGRDVINRKGFQKLFRKLSDEAWEEALELISHVTTRGGHMMPVASSPGLSVEMPLGRNYSQPEILALGRALDLTKSLAEETFTVYRDVTGECLGDSCDSDPELAEFLQRKVMPEHASLVRELAGHVTSVRVMLGSDEKDLGLNLYDEYLQ